MTAKPLPFIVDSGGSVISQRGHLGNAGLDLAAPGSILCHREPGAAADGAFEHAYRFVPALTIYAGTSEIMHSIIAQLSLGLPGSRS